MFYNIILKLTELPVYILFLLYNKNIGVREMRKIIFIDKVYHNNYFFDT